MWPFGKKQKPPPETEPASVPMAEPAPDLVADSPDSHKTAADVLLQLESEVRATEAILPDAEPLDPNLGRALLAEGPITREYLDEQLAVSGKGNSYFGTVLAQAHAASEAQLLRLLAASYTIPEVDLKQCRVHVPTARALPREVALKYKIIPIDRIGDIVCAVFAGEPNPKAIEAVRRETGSRVKALRCPSHHLQILLRRLYPAQDTAPAAPAHATPQAATTVAAVAAIPISKQDYDAVAQSPAARAEARWESLYASKGPIPATRFGRR